MGVIEMWPGDKLVETWHKRPMSPFFISREFLLILWNLHPLVDIVQAYKSDLSLFFLDSLLWFETNLEESKILFSPSGFLCLQFAQGEGAAAACWTTTGPFSWIQIGTNETACLFVFHVFSLSWSIFLLLFPVFSWNKQDLLPSYCRGSCSES